MVFSPNNVITTQVKFEIIWICLESPHNQYCFSVILPPTSDHILASLLVMFRTLSLISCHFEARGTFLLPQNKLLDQEVALASSLRGIVSCAFFLD